MSLAAASGDSLRRLLGLGTPVKRRAAKQPAGEGEDAASDTSSVDAEVNEQFADHVARGDLDRTRAGRREERRGGT